MLSRTADNLYWLARYVERAEYLARILEATHRLTTLPLTYVGSSNEWASAVSTAGCANLFFAKLDPQLLRGRAHQCTCGTYRFDLGNVGRDQLSLARAQTLRQRADLARGV